MNVKNPKKIIVSNISPSDIKDGIDVTVINPDGSTSATVHLDLNISDVKQLTSADVKKIIAQAVAQAEVGGTKATIAVTDKEGNILGVFTMEGALDSVRVGLGTKCSKSGCVDPKLPLICGLEGACVPSCASAISKAVTGAFLSSQGHAFSTRTASFIVQEHFPPGVNFQAGGPLFGVQFSQLLCSDVNARSPLGLSADPGGLPLYKNGLEVGGIGVESDGRYIFDPEPTDKEVSVEELIAVAATRGFEPPPEITGDKIVVNGIRFPYVNVVMPPALPVLSFENLRGTLNRCLGLAPSDVLSAQPSKFRVVSIDDSIPTGRVDDRFFPFKSSSSPTVKLTANDVKTLIMQAAKQAFITRAAIRQPENSPAEVNISVVDTDGVILGVFSTIDAPIFGFDVAVQKARTAAFFSKTTAGAQLRQAGFGSYVDAAFKDGIALDGSIAFSDRAVGFLARPFFPDGIDDTEQGPFSKRMQEFSPFNDGLQLDLILHEYFGNLLNAIGGDEAALQNALNSPCPSIGAVANGLQVFPGSIPLYKNGKLVGGLGVSGDGVDQDDIIAAIGGTGFEANSAMRSDRIFVRGVRLPFLKFPRHPNR